MKFDTNTIEGYADMTAEERVKALESFEYDDNSKELERLKNAVTKANGEAAEWKRKYNAQLSEEEKKKQDAEDELNSLRSEVAQLKANETFANNKTQLLALGYDEALADETAKAMSEGDTAKVFENQKKFLESHDKAYKAQLMSDGVPNPPPGNPGTTGQNYDKLIEEANERGDQLSVAYYTRLKQQEQNNN